MHDIEVRLIDCFSATFAGLPAAAIPLAGVDTLAGWDSMTAVTLLAVVEEEFGIRVPPQDMLRFTSYEEILAYLRERSGSRDDKVIGGVP
jgi:acyl carrier protein